MGMRASLIYVPHEGEAKLEMTTLQWSTKLHENLSEYFGKVEGAGRDLTRAARKLFKNSVYNFTHASCLEFYKPSEVSRNDLKVGHGLYFHDPQGLFGKCGYEYLREAENSHLNFNSIGAIFKESESDKITVTNKFVVCAI